MAAHERYSKVGPFILMDTIGVGSFGKVKLAVHSITYARYACKILDKTLVRERVLSVQVQKEIDIMQRLTHRNTVSLVSVLSSARKVFIVMELVTGGELFDEILRHKRLSEPYARFFFRQLIDGLQHCHEHGVFHRDLKPENLLLDENKTLKITDFGLSTLHAGGTSATASVTGSLTLHTQCGTPNYVAPEIITLDADGYSGAKVDAWSCGIILYVLVAGALPFDASEMDVLFKLILRCDLTYPSYFSPSLVDLISNLLKTNPADRYSLADVRQHPWFNGPEESSMPEQLPQSPQPAAAASSAHSSRSVSTDSTHDPSPPAVPVTGQASLLSQHQLNASASSEQAQQPQEALIPMPRRSSDSLDLGFHAESVGSDFSIPSALAQSSRSLQMETVLSTSPQPAQRIPSTMLPAAISENAAPYQEANGYEGQTQVYRREAGSAVVAEEPRPYVTSGAYSNPLINRLRSRVMASDGGSSSLASSDDEHEFEEAKEMRMPHGFFGPRIRELEASPVTGEDATMRRSHSLNHLAALNDDAAQRSANMQRDGQVSYADVEGQFGMRGRIKRQLWDRAAEAWRTQGASYPEGHPRDSYPEGHAQDISRDADQKQSSRGDFAHPRSGRSADGGVADPQTGSSRDMRRSFSTGKDAMVKSTSVGAELSLSSSDSDASKILSPAGPGRLVRSHSHDGRLTAPLARKRPRPRSRAGTKSKVPASSLADPKAVVTPRTAPGRGVRADASVQKVERNVKLRNGTKPKHPKNPPGTVRFQVEPVEREPQEGSFRPDGDWVHSDVDKMVWCMMMKDFEMICDYDEFGMDSSSLNEMWTKGLAKENFNRKSSFAAHRFGSPTFVPSRSTKYLLSQAAQREEKRRQTHKAAAVKRCETVPGSAAETLLSRAHDECAPSTPNGHLRITDNAVHASISSTSGAQAEGAQVKAQTVRSSVPPLQHIARPITAHPISSATGRPSPLLSASVANSVHSRGARQLSSQVSPAITRSGLPVVNPEACPTIADDTAARLSSVPPHMISEGARAPLVTNGRASPASACRSIMSSDGRDSVRDCVSQASSAAAGSEEPASSVGGQGDLASIPFRGDLTEGVDVNGSEGSGSLTTSSERVIRQGKASKQLGNSEPKSEVHSPEARWISSEPDTNAAAGTGTGSGTGSGTRSSAVNSYSSGAMRSDGSDGLMSTPRDPERNYRGPGDIGKDADGWSVQSVATHPLIIRDGAVVEEIKSNDQTFDDRSRPPLFSRARRDNDESVSPFSLDIPGPKGKSLPSPRPLQGLFQLPNPAKPLLRRGMAPLPVKSYTEFHSLLDPRQCYETVQALLRSYGCCVVKGTVAKRGEKYKIRCEVTKDGTAVAANVSVFKIDKRLTVVLFKRKGRSGANEFFDFYNEVHRMYCEEWEKLARDNHSRSDDSPSRRGANRVQFQEAGHGTGLQGRAGSTSGRNGNETLSRTESSGSGRPGMLRKKDLECLTPTT